MAAGPADEICSQSKDEEGFFAQNRRSEMTIFHLFFAISKITGPARLSNRGRMEPAIRIKFQN
jgi:hypothetical protein